MVEVFITDIDQACQSQRVTALLKSHFAALRVNVDLEGTQTGVEFPCRHTVLRAEGDAIDANGIIAIVNQVGFKCEVLADKICR